MQFYVLLNVVLKRKRVMKFCVFIFEIFCNQKYRSNEIEALKGCNRLCFSIATFYAFFTASCYTIFVGVPILGILIHFILNKINKK